MNTLPFVSQNTDYKRPFGAVCEDTEIEYRILLHDDALCEHAWMIFHGDKWDAPWHIPMEKCETIGEYAYYSCRLTLKTGLYFYNFAYNGGTGEYKITKDAQGNGVLNKNGEEWQQTVYDKDFETPKWFSHGIMYQIFPDRFCRNGDTIKSYPDRCYVEDLSQTPAWRQDEEVMQNGGYLGNDYFGGNLKGITKKLLYLRDLSVSCIYLNPIFEAHSNHRYNTADYCKIDPTLGTKADLRELIKRADKLGIKIILDGVFSHTGDDSIYFNKECRYDSIGAYNSKSSPYYNWYKFDKWPNKYGSWWGIKTLPEVIEDAPEYTEFITGEKGVLKNWLNDGIYGWRLDVADELPNDFLNKVRSAIKSENKDALLLGEVWEDATSKISYGDRRVFLQGGQLDSVMNYPFRDAIIAFMQNGDGRSFIKSVMDIVENYPKPALDTLMNHIGTHDTPRILTILGGEPQNSHPRSWQAEKMMSDEEYKRAVKLLKIAATLQFTLPGVPCIYYGDEAGMQGYGDPFNRAFYPWGHENDELLDFYKALGKQRSECAAFDGGEFLPLVCESGLIAFARQNGETRAVIAVNLRGSETVIEGKTINPLSAEVLVL